MPDEESPHQGLNSLYISEDTLTSQILGVDFEFKEIPGEEYAKILDQCVQKDGTTVNRSKYCRLLLEKTLVKPKDLDLDRIKPSAYTLLIAELERLLGLSEVALKNLERR